VGSECVSANIHLRLECFEGHLERLKEASMGDVLMLDFVSGANEVDEMVSLSNSADHLCKDYVV
jgi:hypothetical protein